MLLRLSRPSLDAAKHAVGDVLDRVDELSLIDDVTLVMPPHHHNVSQHVVRVDLHVDDGATAPHGASGNVKANLNILVYRKHDR